MHGKPVECRRCPRNGQRDVLRQARYRIRAHPPSGLRGRSPRNKEPRMKPFSIAGLARLTALGAQAQSQIAFQSAAETVVVTATRAITPEATPHNVTLISRENIQAAGPISLGGLRQRPA